MAVEEVEAVREYLVVSPSCAGPESQTDKAQRSTAGPEVIGIDQRQAVTRQPGFLRDLDLYRACLDRIGEANGIPADLEAAPWAVPR